MNQSRDNITYLGKGRRPISKEEWETARVPEDQVRLEAEKRATEYLQSEIEEYEEFIDDLAIRVADMRLKYDRVVLQAGNHLAKNKENIATYQEIRQELIKRKTNFDGVIAITETYTTENVKRERQKIEQLLKRFIYLESVLEQQEDLDKKITALQNFIRSHPHRLNR